MIFKFTPIEGHVTLLINLTLFVAYGVILLARLNLKLNHCGSHRSTSFCPFLGPQSLIARRSDF
jgi:hypothetical protein